MICKSTNYIFLFQIKIQKNTNILLNKIVDFVFICIKNLTYKKYFLLNKINSLKINELYFFILSEITVILQFYLVELP